MFAVVVIEPSLKPAIENNPGSGSRPQSKNFLLKSVFFQESLFGGFVSLPFFDCATASKTSPTQRTEQSQIKTFGLAEDTLIRTPEGRAPLKSLEEGDIILAWNWAKQEFLPKTILKINNEGNALSKLPPISFLLLLEQCSKPVHATEHQPFWTKDEKGEIRIKPASAISRGDSLIAYKKDGLVWRPVLATKKSTHIKEFYSLGYGDNDCFIADDVLAVPASEPTRAPSHKEKPFLQRIFRR